MKKFIAANLFAFVFFANAALANITTTIIAKTQTCAACHGAQGISANPVWPNLAGQHAAYLRKQLHDYKTGQNRNAVIMTGVAANLSEQDIYDLAKYYASLPPNIETTPQQYQALGKEIYQNGNIDKGLMACIACHGPAGAGNDEAGFPMLSGQHAEYTMQQLHFFKNKTRHNDLNNIMQDICGHMNQEDMEAVAYYIQGLTL